MEKLSGNIERDWVDMFTNRSFVQNLNPASLTDILLSHRFPKEIFLSLVHEATHHWCFSSLLGNALFFVKMRAYLTAVKSRNHLLRKWEVYSDYTRFYTLKKIYDPLSEGLALFAEYDVYSTPTEAVPAYLVFMSIVFSGFDKGDWEIENYQKFEDAYNYFLYERRILSRQGQNRKSILLTHPVSLAQSPYLTGYLFIKNLQGILMGVSDKFKDPNIFLQYIKAYYFEDPDLVHMLLNEEIADEEIVPVFLEYFNERTAKLIKMPRDNAEKFEIAINQPATPAFYELLLVTDTRGAAIRELEKKMLEQFNSFNDSWYLFFMRSFFKLTRLRCYLKVTPERIKLSVRLPGNSPVNKAMATLLDTGLAVRRDGYIDILSGSFPNLEGNESYEGEAFFEKYISFAPVQRAFDVILTEKATIFLPVSSSLSPEDDQQVRTYFTRMYRNMDLWDMDEKLEKLWKNDSTVEEIERFHRENNFSRISDYYEGTALHVPDARLAEVRSLMKDQGFWKLLDGREDLIDLLSLLSLLTSLMVAGDFPDIKELTDFIAEEHTKADIEELDTKLQRYGFDILVFTEWLTMTISV